MLIMLLYNTFLVSGGFKTMNIVLIDDDIQFLKEFEIKVKKQAKKIFDYVNVDISTDASILDEKKYSIYFLDIDLIDSNGIDIAKKLKQKSKALAIVIFITSHNDLVFNAMTVQPFYFIRKSNIENDIITAFILIKDYFINKESYVFKYNGEDIILYVEDIIYIEINDHLSTIYTNSNKFHLYKSLIDLLNEINSPLIVQVNRKQCINISHITKQNRNNLYLDNLIQVKIGNKYRNEFEEKLNNYLIQSNSYVI